MTTLLRQAPAVNVDCLSCGTTLLMPEVAGGLCGLCHAEVMSDMKSEREIIEELTRQRDRLLAAAKSVLDALDEHEYGIGSDVFTQLRNAITATGADSVP